MSVDTRGQCLSGGNEAMVNAISKGKVTFQDIVVEHFLDHTVGGWSCSHSTRPQDTERTREIRNLPTDTTTTIYRFYAACSLFPEGSSYKSILIMGLNFHLLIYTIESVEFVLVVVSENLSATLQFPSGLVGHHYQTSHSVSCLTYSAYR